MYLILVIILTTVVFITGGEILRQGKGRDGQLMDPVEASRRYWNQDQPLSGDGVWWWLVSNAESEGGHDDQSFPMGFFAKVAGILD